MAALTPDKPADVLALCVAGGGPFQKSDALDAACWLGGQDSRRWLRVKGGLQATRGDPRYENWTIVAQADAGERLRPAGGRHVMAIFPPLSL